MSSLSWREAAIEALKGAGPLSFIFDSANSKRET